MKTRIEKLGSDRKNYIELTLTPKRMGSLSFDITMTVGPPRRDGKDITLSLSRREAYQIADTLRAMAYSADERL